MAITTVTAKSLTLDTRSDDIPLAAHTDIATGADGWTVDLSGYEGRPVLFVFEDSAGGTIVVNAGDRPPSEREGIGASTVEAPGGRMITLAANDVRYISLDRSRFTQSDGCVTGLASTNTASMMVLVLPRNWG
jgi:hypothetical protein